MFTYRKKTKDVNVGPVIAQPNQAFTVRQIIDQYARGEVIPTMFESTDTLSDDIDDDAMEDIIEFEDKIDAEAHLLANQYKLFENEPESSKEQESPSETGKSSLDSPVETAG